MATFNFVNNCIGQLFDILESHMGGVKLATFSMSETTKVAQSPDASNKRFMQQYQQQFDEQMYKYIYDPNLSFDERFHQRLASIGFDNRREPWITIMYNTGSVRTVTDIVSTNQYLQIQNFDIKTKRVRVPVNLVLVSNDVSTLYYATEHLALFWDRIVNFEYCEFVKFDTGTEDEYEKSGQAVDITEIDLQKLDTSSRGGLVTSAYSFGLVYWVTQYPEFCHVLDKITIDIGVLNQGTLYSINVQ